MILHVCPISRSAQCTHPARQTLPSVISSFPWLSTERDDSSLSYPPSLPHSRKKIQITQPLIKNLVVLFLLTYSPSSLFSPCGKAQHMTHKGRRTTHTKKKKSTFHTFIYALCWYVNGLSLSHSLSLLPACLVPGRAGPKVGRFTYIPAKPLLAAAAPLSPTPPSVPPSVSLLTLLIAYEKILLLVTTSWTTIPAQASMAKRPLFSSLERLLMKALASEVGARPVKGRKGECKGQ